MVVVSTEVAGSWFAVFKWLGRQFPWAAFVPIGWNFWTSHLTKPLLHDQALASQPNTASCYYSFSQFIHRWIRYLWNVDSYVVREFKVLSCFELFKLLGLNAMGVILWPIIPFYLYPLSTKDGTGSVQSFDRAYPASVVERLILFELSDHHFWIQWCSDDATSLYLFECRSRYIDTKNMYESIPDLCSEFATACNKYCNSPGASMMCSGTRY